MSLKVSFVFLLVVINNVHSFSIKSKNCAISYIDCYSTDVNDTFKLRFTVDNTLNGAKKTFEYVKNLKQKNPSVECAADSCGEKFHELFKNSTLIKKTEHSQGTGADVHQLTQKSGLLQSEQAEVIYGGMYVPQTNVSTPEKEDVNNSLTSSEDIDVTNSEAENSDLFSDVFGDDEEDWGEIANSNDTDIMDREKFPGYPITFTLKPGFGTNMQNRSKRYSRPCAIENLKFSAVRCEKWPNVLICKQKCIHGYGIETPKGTRTVQNYKCRFLENKWKPQHFEDCKPYMNCKVALKADMPGKLNCKQESHSKPPYCHIWCGSDGEMETRVCSEGLENDLPNCVELENVELIPQPE